MTARLKGPENHGGFSHGGVSYEPDADGFIEVPHEALAAAFSHGFTLAPEQPGSPVGGIGQGGADGDTPDDTPVDLVSLSKKQLVAFAKDNLDLELNEGSKKDELIAAIEAALAEKAAAHAVEAAKDADESAEAGDQ